MMFIIRKLILGLAGLAIAATCSTAFAIVQLGFALDESGSIGSTDYAIEQQGLADAIAALPLDGSIEISVVSFSGGVQTLVSPTILTAATVAAITGGITGDTYTGGSTNTAAAINSLTTLMTGSANGPIEHSLINITTDGSPTSGGGGGVSAQQAAINAALNAAANGIDSISFEVIDGSNATIAASAQIAFPGPVQILAANSVVIPNPLTGSFVIPVTNIAAYAPVIAAKVQSVANVPVSGTLGLMLLGLAGFGAVRTRQSA